jgi:lipopolysaccharide export system protein LptA
MKAKSAAMFFCAAVAAVAAAVPAGAREGVKPRPAIDRSEPLQVDADRLDAYNDKRTVVFSGNVVASQGARTIRSESLTIYYRDAKKTDNKKSPLKAISSDQEAGDVEKIEAHGKVEVTEGARTATGDAALFEQDDQKITMTGNAVLKEGDNVVRGDKVIIYLDENRGVVEGGAKGRVSATIYPGDKK